MRDDAVRWLTPAGPRHDFAPPPEHGRLRRAGVASPAERRRAVRGALRRLGTLAVVLVIAPAAVGPLSDSLAVDPVVLWMGVMAAVVAAPSAGRRLVGWFADGL